MQGLLEEVNLLQEITEACRSCVRAFVEDRTDSQGQVSIDSFANIARNFGFQKQPWEEALKVCMGGLRCLLFSQLLSLPKGQLLSWTST